MTDAIHTNPVLRHDFALLFDVTDGNPNGDPDAGNLPRLDPETMQGLVTDVCLKRKVRDWAYAMHGGEQGYDIYVKHRTYLVDFKKRAYEAVGAKKGDDKKADDAREWMCQNCYDVRMFGAVLVGKKGEGYSCGQVRGPVQLGFARSVDPVTPLDLSITRVALENPGEKPREDEDEKAATGTMGRKAIVPYGLYRCHGFFTPAFAERTGASQQDMVLLWQALQDMWEQDHSAARGQMACRGLYVFTHNSKIGSAPAHKLFDRISVRKRPEVDAPRKFSDYTVTVSSEELPDGVILTRLAG